MSNKGEPEVRRIYFQRYQEPELCSEFWQDLPPLLHALKFIGINSNFSKLMSDGYRTLISFHIKHTVMNEVLKGYKRMIFFAIEFGKYS